jgi:hypothetical protein
MRRVAIAFVAALFMASLAGPAMASKPAASGFLPPGHGYSEVNLATQNLLWSAAPDFAQSKWVTETCGPSPKDRDLWFLGGPPVNPASGLKTCWLPAGKSLVVEAADLIVSKVWGDGDNPAQLRASLNTYWPNLTVVKVTFDKYPPVNPTAYVATTRPVMMPANDWLFDTPSLTMARYYQFVTRPLSRGNHTLQVHYETIGDPWGVGTVVERDYTIIVY